MDNNSNITHYKLGWGSITAITFFLLGFYLAVTNAHINELIGPANDWSNLPPVIETIKSAKEKLDLTPVQTAALRDYAECRHMKEYFEEYSRTVTAPIRYSIDCEGLNLTLTTEGGVRDDHVYMPYAKYFGWFYAAITAYATYCLWTRSRGFLYFLVYFWIFLVYLY
jgi:hypothetical protein